MLKIHEFCEANKTVKDSIGASAVFAHFAGCCGKHLTLPGYSTLPKTGQREKLSQTHARNDTGTTTKLPWRTPCKRK